ncbi:hypothetical protein QBC39DRAFT_333675 [Podospora conica]|nr:hypothetical protein QBC39DRAFT_333675 [Schizothecium conicum]
MDYAFLDRNKTPSGIRTLISQMTRQFRCLDMQAVTFLVDWTPADFQETPTPPDVPLVSESAFQFPDQAADQLQVLVARVMSLRDMEHFSTPSPGSCSAPAEHPREQAFDGFLPQFQQCLAWADEITMGHYEQILTSEVGIIPVLYIIGVKWRHPGLRREAVHILTRRSMREAVWHSVIILIPSDGEDGTGERLEVTYTHYTLGRPG